MSQMDPIWNVCYYPSNLLQNFKMRGPQNSAARPSGRYLAIQTL